MGLEVTESPFQAGDEMTAVDAANLAFDALTLAGVSLEHQDAEENVANIRRRINEFTGLEAEIVACVLASVAQWLTDASADRGTEADTLQRNPDPWERVVGAAAACEAATLADLAAEALLAAELVQNPNTAPPRIDKTRTSTPSKPSPARVRPENDRGVVLRSGLKWYRRAWDSADADGSVDDVIEAVENAVEVTPDPTGHGRTRMTANDVTVVVTPDGVILAWWRGQRD